MSEQEQPRNLLREAALFNKTSLEYILGRVETQKEIHQMKIDKGMTTAPYSNYDLAEFFSAELAHEIITQKEMEESLPHLGFSFEEANKFVEDTMSEAQTLIELKIKEQGGISFTMHYWGPSENSENQNQ